MIGLKLPPKINLKYTGFIIAGCYLLFIFLLYYTEGINTAEEGSKYLRYVNRISVNGLSALHDKWAYSTYILFLYVLLKAGGVYLVAVIQTLLHLAVAYFLYKTVEKLTANTLIALIGVIAYLFNYSIQYWTLTLFSESFFTCLIVFLLYRLFTKPVHTSTLPTTLLIMVMISFARPSGAMFTIPAFIYIISKLYAIKPWMKWSIFLLLIGLCYGILITNTSDDPDDFARPIAEASIICGFPEKPIQGALPFTEYSIISAYDYLFSHHSLMYISGTFIRKAVSFFTLTRSYFSLSHNLLLVPVYLLYIPAFLALFRNKKSKHASIIQTLFVMLALNVLLVMVTFNEWHGRFITPSMPVIILLAMLSLNRLIPMKKD